jgi:hypothetical protein
MSPHFMQITNDIMSESFAEPKAFTLSRTYRSSPYAALAAEVTKNYRENQAAVWYKNGIDENDETGKYAFQRLHRTWFTPHVVPKFKLRRDDV